MNKAKRNNLRRDERDRERQRERKLVVEYAVQT